MSHYHIVPSQHLFLCLQSVSKQPLTNKSLDLRRWTNGIRGQCKWSVWSRKVRRFRGSGSKSRLSGSQWGAGAWLWWEAWGIILNGAMSTAVITSKDSPFFLLKKRSFLYLCNLICTKIKSYNRVSKTNHSYSKYTYLFILNWMQCIGKLDLNKEEHVFYC